MIDEKYIKETPCVAYLAHPYGGDHQNLVEARMLAGTLYEQYPKLTILNPLDNGEYMLGDDEENIINHDLELLARCDVLLLAPGWEDSKGCNKELNKALDKAMDILKVEDDGEDVTLSVFRQATLTFDGQTMSENWQKLVEEAARALKADDNVEFAFVHVVGRSAGRLCANGFAAGSGDDQELISNAQVAAITVTRNIVEGLCSNKDARAKIEKRLGMPLDSDFNVGMLTAGVLNTAAQTLLDSVKEQRKNHDTK